MKNRNTTIAQLEEYIFRKYDLRINVITQELEAKSKKNGSFKLLNLNDLYYELSHEGFKRYKDELSTILGSSIIKRFDPFEDYFQNLVPYVASKEPDHILMLSKFIKTDDQKWFETAFRKFLVQVAAQSLNKIDFNKFCLTLVGEQHDGKTTFLDFLVPKRLNKYLKKGFDFGKSKEAKFSLVQNFIINLDELTSFEKRELNNEFKAVLSESLVKYRPLYSNQEATFMRKASFLASTNQQEFLTDETGNVRWLIFNVRKINHDYGGRNGYNSQVDIDRVWAQAYSLLKNNFEYTFTRDEVIRIENRNRSYSKSSDEAEYIRKHLKPASKNEEGAEFFVTSEITEILRRNGLTGSNRNFVGKALRAEGFKLGSRYNSQIGHTEKGYWLLYNRFPQSS